MSEAAAFTQCLVWQKGGKGHNRQCGAAQVTTAQLGTGTTQFVFPALRQLQKGVRSLQ